MEVAADKQTPAGVARGKRMENGKVKRPRMKCCTSAFAGRPCIFSKDHENERPDGTKYHTDGEGIFWHPSHENVTRVWFDIGGVASIEVGTVEVSRRPIVRK